MQPIKPDYGRLMEDPQNQDASKPGARLYFARRLRELRAVREFRTARSLARALGIDENRYTRYERAEVEPDLELLMRICRVLGASPNDLLGGGDARSWATSDPEIAELVEARQSSKQRSDREGLLATGLVPPPVDQRLTVQSIAWALADLVVRLRQSDGAPARQAASNDLPLAHLRLVTAMQQDIRQRPYESIAQIVTDPAVAGAAIATKREVDVLVQRLTEALSRAFDASNEQS